MCRIEKTLNINIPKAATKQLKIQTYSEDKRKIVLSSNWLVLFGFEAVSSTIMSEQVGQSIEVPLHEEILNSIHKHILESNMLLSGKLF
jgi:hypothetical protein